MTAPFCQQPALLMRHLDISRFEIITCTSVYKKGLSLLAVGFSLRKLNIIAVLEKKDECNFTVPSRNNNNRKQ